MTPEIRNWVEKQVKNYSLNRGRILEVGSLNINGQVRDLFEGCARYHGIDTHPGPGVDEVANFMHGGLAWALDGAYDTIVCCEVIEHTPDPCGMVYLMSQILKPGRGILILTAPTFGFPLHRFPKDYWRFGEDAFRDVLLKGMEIMDLTEVRDHLGNPGLCAIARRTR